MANLDSDIDTETDEDASVALESKLSKKKLMFILLPALIIIASIGFYYKAHSDKDNAIPLNYSIIQNNSEDASSAYTILYDLPEIEVRLQTIAPPPQLLRIKINIELSGVENIPTIDALVAKLSDVILTHTSGLTTEEVNSSEGLYWLKKELLYRINLITAPIKITNLNFKNFEIVKG